MCLKIVSCCILEVLSKMLNEFLLVSGTIAVGLYTVECWLGVLMLWLGVSRNSEESLASHSHG